MKTSEIITGKFYFDGKEGLREVISLDGNPLVARFRILAAKKEQEFSSALKQMVSIIGSESSCCVESLAVWAKSCMDKVEAIKLLSELRAKKMKMTANELSLLNGHMHELGAMIDVGSVLFCDTGEERTMRSLEKKGVIHQINSKFVLTELGAAWFRIKYQKNTTLE